jgi:hypothetical protein
MYSFVGALMNLRQRLVRTYIHIYIHTNVHTYLEIFAYDQTDDLFKVVM